MMGELTRYIRERYPLVRFTALAIVLACAGMLGSPLHWPQAAGTFVAAAITVWFMSFPLRLRDDIASYAIDRKLHPKRVLARSKDVTPFWYLWGASTVVASVAIGAFANLNATLGYVGLIASMEIGYRTGWLRQREEGWSALVILLKYPILIALLQGIDDGAWIQGWPGSVLITAAFVAFEIIDDHRLVKLRGARWVTLGSLGVVGSTFIVATVHITTFQPWHIALFACLVGPLVWYMHRVHSAFKNSRSMGNEVLGTFAFAQLYITILIALQMINSVAIHNA